MSKRFAFIGVLMMIACCWTACKDDVANTGQSVLTPEDEIIVLVDTFSFRSMVDSCDAIISQADSFLLGEIETDYGVLRASILTQMACPEGYAYPADFHVDSIDSICLFMYYSSWEGDANSPLAINAYMMDKKTFSYSGTYPTDLNIDDYCTRSKSVLTNHRIVVASEKLDSIQGSDGTYLPMVRMRVNDDFMTYFGSITSFDDQDSFNDKFKGLLIETSFGSSTVLNISDIALGVFYHFTYSKNGKDTTVNDMKAFYANSEVRTVNHLFYEDKKQLVEEMQQDSDTYNYIVAPAGVYTRLEFPMEVIADTIISSLIYDTTWNATHDSVTILFKRPYVNKAQVRVEVTNVFSGATDDITRDDWLQPAAYMLLIKENSMERFFKNKELPSDTCALLSALQQGTDSLGNTTYFYSYDLSDFLTNQLRKESGDSYLSMMLVPVTVNINSSSVVTSVRQQQTISATQIRSAKNGMSLEIVYSGF
ncbi:MAG: DUF4270 family protein [Paludibacteraceae bacterium]|nr:DUF4270 family protein [Paludibacteraceae bacterium]